MQTNSSEDVCRNIQNVKLKLNNFVFQLRFIVMFVTAVCVLFLISIHVALNHVVIYNLNTCRIEYDIVSHNLKKILIRSLILYLNIFYDQQICLQ